ncbi:8685_t:CDS:2 [Diversispora eburnea]|uniref:8685_t:CDS:1 n=1 Tax=Diversispora eburnea TaxID=1213867 RepID=A0A9N8VKQ0_9GLOM|nr:8685_t:CDS:2 [Diversispora eburnea]
MKNYVVKNIIINNDNVIDNFLDLLFYIRKKKMVVDKLEGGENSFKVGGENDNVEFKTRRIFFKLEIIDGEIRRGDLVFGKPKEGLYVEYQGAGWKEMYGDE